MDLDALRKLIGKDWDAYRDFLYRQIGSDVSLLRDLNAEVLSHEGKQLRPLLCLLAARACGTGAGGVAVPESGSASLPELTLRYAVAGELLHNATLLHDDVADESDLRRGRPTVRSLFGPDVSVLLGDFWLARAVDGVVSGNVCDPEVIRLFSKTLQDLAEGEMLQLERAADGKTDEDAYLRIIYGKTASLFEACTVAGACSVGASAVRKQAVSEFARCLGLAFQIRDDIFDYSPELDTGKPSGEDIGEKKITLPLLGAFENAGHLREEALRADIVAARPGVKEGVLAYVREFDGIGYAQRRLETFVERASAALDVLEDSVWKDAMKQLARYVAVRKV